jgi:hypothetical protein
MTCVLEEYDDTAVDMEDNVDYDEQDEGKK